MKEMAARKSGLKLFIQSGLKLLIRSVLFENRRQITTRQYLSSTSPEALLYLLHSS
jgi:hypothetical protein